MAVVSFDDFCHSICGLIGVEPPSLEPEPDGTVGFTVTYHDASVGFMKADREGEEGLLMMVEFGIPPPEKESDILRVLMDANFRMTGVGTPAFTRNPDTGEIALHYGFLLSQVDVQNVYQGIATAAETVAHWRSNYFLDEPPQHEALGNAGLSAANFA